MTYPTYGTQDESERWVERLNRNRHGNFYCAKKLAAAEVQELRLDEGENKETLSIARALTSPE